ncbi:MAG: aminotransferase, partial [Alphaproteobacteria bacterium]|nr:aminotransferase [Alphaproteobacteria bacterium]
MKSGNGILSSYGTTIFEVVSGLAREHGAVNLGQGAPEGMEPADVVARAAQAVLDGPNQYPPLMGTPGLRRAVAAHEKRFYGLDVDWESEVMVTSGATGALADALFGLIEEGDEIILLEPLYDSYLPIIRRAGGVPRLVRLAPPDWTLPRDRLAAAFSPRTKAILLNSPANPCGKVYTEDELDFIARLVRDHDAYAICDEVYEHLVFDGRKHIPLMTRPGMRDRCVRIASAGKIFSVTGWKIGMLVAAPDLLRPIIKAHQFLTFTVPPNFQTAVAYGLEKEDGYFTTLIQDMQARRDRLAAGLAGVGFRVLPCGGSYFLTADIGALGNADDDVALCPRMTP